MLKLNKLRKNSFSLKLRFLCFVLSACLVCPLGIVQYAMAAEQKSSLSDLTTDVFDSKTRKDDSRNPFSPGAVDEKTDAASLVLEGIVVGGADKLCLISGRILREGDLFGSFLVKKIKPGQVDLKGIDGTVKLMMDGYVPDSGSQGSQYEVMFQGASLNNALRIIAMAGDFNIASPDGIEGRVSVVFHDTPIKDALGSILRVNNLEYADENNIIRVGKADAFPSGANFVTKSFVLKYASAEGLAETVKDHLTEKGTVSFDQRTNSLIVKDNQSVIQDVGALVSQLDKQDVEIHIEAKILDVKRNFSRSIGIQWGFSKSSGQVQGFGASSVGNVAGGTNASNVNLPVVNPTSGIGILIGNVVNNTSLEAQITAAEEKGDAHIISQPSITTVNNTPAKIRSGLKVYVKTTSTIAVGGSSGSSSGEDSGLQEIDTGIELTVTPQMTASDIVKLKIDAVESEADFTRTVDNIPAVIDNTASTTVLVKDGETTVIGGMMKVNKSTTSQGVPVISTIPILGWLFKNKTKAKSDNELLIFITPRVIHRQGEALKITKSPPTMVEIQNDSITIPAKTSVPKNRVKSKYRRH